MNFDSFIQENGKQVIFKKHEHVFMQGESNDNFYFLRSGLLKAYYVLEDGRESVKSFILSGNTITSLTAAYTKEQCSFSLVALQESQLIEIPFDCIEEATRRSHDMARKVIEILLSLSMKKERREYELLSLPAEERYRQLCETSPQLIEAVTQNDIARYLGITPVALSRIKKRLLNMN
ncbi:Crp/Fnr family transcriptional regulator [Aliikangiella coralliicola]|uniref:Crp/Fnr family transcriptional regulator n=1 Tax=Aliikangiella coralliicola TaxID=2592383 RepID=A0A545UIR2_9GAMM|nr:Crp/Fnr family transcriptional regulator [Aliikangiella coralliicola]TQV89348.1 Crp/Fnr family transcriptional regulator [Aliikangiella coralliicola]